MENYLQRMMQNLPYTVEESNKMMKFFKKIGVWLGISMCSRIFRDEGRWLDERAEETNS